MNRLAYPDAAGEMVIVLAKGQFIDSSLDEDTRPRIRQSRPTRLRQALEIAMELESYPIASKKTKVQKVHLVMTDASNDEKPDSDNLLKQLEACIKAMQCGRKGKRRNPNREKKTLPDAKITARTAIDWRLKRSYRGKRSMVSTSLVGL